MGAGALRRVMRRVEGFDDALADALDGVPFTGDVTVALELAGQPRFSSAASWACAWATASSSFETVPRAASIVDAFVGFAVAFASVSAVFAVATWASATRAVDSAALSAPALVPFGRSTV